MSDTNRTDCLCTSCSEITPRGAKCTSCGENPEASMLPCWYCEGSGRVQRMRAATACHFHPDDCIEGSEDCPQCHGFGVIEPEFVVEADAWAINHARVVEVAAAGGVA